MRYQRNTLLAGIAALALIAGAGLASAQEQSQDHHGTPQIKEPHAAAQPTNHAPAAVRIGPSAQQEKSGAMTEQPNRRADEMNRATKTKAGENRAAQTGQRQEGALARGKTTKMGKTAEERNHIGRERVAHPQSRQAAQDRHGKAKENTTAQRGHNGLEGLQGNASGVNVQLNDEQRTQIRRTVIEARGAPRVDHVNFDVQVGTVIPRREIHVAPVPETLVRIYPDWRRYLYFVYEDEVVVVNPGDMRIVAVLPV